MLLLQQKKRSTPKKVIINDRDDCCHHLNFDVYLQMFHLSDLLPSALPYGLRGILEARTTTATAIAVRQRKEILKLVASAMNPTSGGPMRRPINPRDETAVNAVPGDSVVDLPAAL